CFIGLRSVRIRGSRFRFGAAGWLVLDVRIGVACVDGVAVVGIVAGVGARRLVGCGLVGGSLVRGRLVECRSVVARPVIRRALRIVGAARSGGLRGGGILRTGIGVPGGRIAVDQCCKTV